MKKIETIEINEKQYTISELTVKQIINIAQSGRAEKGLALITNKDLAITDMLTVFLDEVKIIIEKCCSFTIEDLEELAPSEIKLLLDAFKKVNSDFLSVLRVAGVNTALSKIKEQVELGFSKSLAD